MANHSSVLAWRIPGMGEPGGCHLWGHTESDTTEVTQQQQQSQGASLVSQMVKNLPAMREIWVRSLGWEDPLEEGMATHSSILAWTIPMDRGDWWATVHKVAKSQTRLGD